MPATAPDSEPPPPPPLLLASLPAPLRAHVTKAWRQLAGNLSASERDAWRQALAAAPLRAAQLAKCWAVSRQVARLCARHPDWLWALWHDAGLERPLCADDYARRWRALGTDDTASAEALAAALRAFRQHEWMRIVWRESNGLADLAQLTAELSALAEVCVDAALASHSRALSAAWGVPIGAETGRAQQLVVLGMGKLGGHELNLSSDIDLIFAYEEAGETRPGNGARSRSNQEFFAALGQRLIAALDQPSESGFVFRVDMRLRPFGSEGLLALSFDAMTHYYLRHGRDWERYALIKARPVAGDRAAGARLMARLRPFVYRSYLDFGALDSLRAVHRSMREKTERSRIRDDLKRSAGGIRDLELAVQIPQLVYGGKDASLRCQNFQAALDGLARRGMFDGDDARALRDAYCFLRRAEHAVQAWDDRQSHRLPGDDAPRAALAFYLDCPSWAEFLAALERHRAFVRDWLAARVDSKPQPSGQWELLWRGEMDDESTRALLSESGFDELDDAQRQLAQLRGSQAVRHLRSTAADRLHGLMPMLLEAVAANASPDATLRRCLAWLAKVLRRSSYLALLAENPLALRQLVSLFSASPWIAETLSRYPALLDELLSGERMPAQHRREALRDGLRSSLRLLAPSEVDLQLRRLCYFRLNHSVRVAIRQLRGELSEDAVGEELAALAEAVLAQALEMAWREVDVPAGDAAEAMPPAADVPGFLVIAYGRLGSGELGYDSDLDLVFVHGAPDAPDAPDAPGGNGPGMDESAPFIRLARRLIHWLSAQTLFGRLYAIDSRLRPSGQSGLLVTTERGFFNYQREQAWVWEHQALVKARPVAGDPGMAARFADLRKELLCRPRDSRKLAAAVRKMRDKMYGELNRRPAANRFHFKHGRGGEVDIDFLVQYLVLAHANEHTELAEHGGIIALLDCQRRCGVLPAATAAALQAAYRAYRRQAHESLLRGEGPLVADAQFARHREAVLSAWSRHVPS